MFRYRYAPSALETLVNDGGIVGNLGRAPWKWLLVPGFLLGMIWATCVQLRRIRPDLIHAHWLIPQGFVVALLALFNRKMPPLLVTSHGADLFALRSSPFQAIKRFVLRRAAFITVVSDAMRDEVARLGGDPARVSVQPMGVDLTGVFTPEPETPRSSCEILFVGRLVEKKGLRHLIQAMPAIVQAHPTALLTVAGFGPEAASCRQQAHGLGLGEKVRFLGAVRQAELPALYRRAAVFVAPFVQAASGDREGLGLVVVEAAGCGCPLVVSDMPSVRDIFGEAHPCRLVPPGESVPLGASIIEVLADPVAASRHAAVLRDFLLTRFDWTIVARNYSNALRALIPARV